MTKTPAENLLDLARLSGAMVQALAVQEAKVLHLVRAEMDALGNLVLTPRKATDPKDYEAETEASFDNMPV